MTVKKEDNEFPVSIKMLLDCVIKSHVALDDFNKHFDSVINSENKKKRNTMKYMLIRFDVLVDLAVDLNNLLVENLNIAGNLDKHIPGDSQLEFYGRMFNGAKIYNQRALGHRLKVKRYSDLDSKKTVEFKEVRKAKRIKKAKVVSKSKAANRPKKK